MKVEFFRHSLTEEDRFEVYRTLGNIFLSTGPKVAEFEQEFAKYLGVKHVIATSSCTMSLFLSMKALGIGVGDEVITTPLTFVATANAIVQTGAKPIFVDVNRDTCNIDHKKIIRAITRRTRAILPVHLYGTMADISELKNICVDHRLDLIEDAAHCIEGSIRRIFKPGDFGDTACFSFYATKNMTSGEGGAIATNNDILVPILRRMTRQGIEVSTLDRHNGAAPLWNMKDMGYKANMTDIQATMLLCQLPRLGIQLQRRKDIYNQYKDGLQGVVTIPSIPQGYHSAHHLFTIQVYPSQRDYVIKELKNRGVGCTVNYEPVHRLEYYQKQYNLEYYGHCPNAEFIGASTISLPFYPSLRDEEIDYVIQNVKGVLNGVHGS